MDHFIFDQHYRSTRDSPNLLYHGFPEEPWSRPGSTLARIGKKRKKHFTPFLSKKTSFDFVYILLNNPHDRSIFLCSILWGGKRGSLPEIFALLCFILLLLPPACKRASRQIGVFSFPQSRRAPNNQISQREFGSIGEHCKTFA